MSNVAGVSDTGPRAAALQTEIYRRMTPEERVAQALALCDSARKMAAAGILERNPEATNRERFRILVDLVLGPDLARRAYGPR